MISDVEHVFMYDFRKTSIQVFCPFLVGLFAFLLLNCISSLYMLDINLLSDI